MELDNIITLAGKFQSHLELQAYCDAQYVTLQKANELVAQLQAEVKHLKELLANTPLTDSTPEIIIKSTEQAICEIEIDRLKKTAMDRGLTLEETKRLDLLVKNLMLSKAQFADIRPDYRNLPRGVTADRLIEIAGEPDSVDEA